LAGFKNQMKVAKQLVRGLLCTAGLLIGLAIYVIFKRTPAFAYQCMIGLFCLTKGYSNDVLSHVIGLWDRPYHFSNADGVLGNMMGKGRDRVVSRLREDGYYVFEDRLPEELCDRLLQYATSHTCKMRPMDGKGLGKPMTVTYHQGAPQAVRYDFDIQDLLNNQDIQNLLADLSFSAVAQDYLRARPVIDIISMWWHTDFSDKPDSEAAQYYHFDMDRLKWLKFFIYLTDVEPANGPHIFVAGSHKSGGIPSSLLSKGYARLMDEEVAREFDESKIIEFAAPRGTIIAEDTRGLHKGKHVEKGDRLIFQIQFSNSLFGGYYPKVLMGKELGERLRETVKRYPDLYSAYS
jgi:hypothetical protein